MGDRQGYLDAALELYRRPGRRLFRRHVPPAPGRQERSSRRGLFDGQAEPPPDRNPSCLAAEESGRRFARAVLESMDAIKLDGGVCPSWNGPPHRIGALNSPHDKLAGKRQSLETKPISRGTESSNPVPSTGRVCELLVRKRRSRSPTRPKQPGASKGVTTSFTAPAY